MTPKRWYRVAGLLLFPALWVVLSMLVKVPERYLPSPSQVLEAALTIRPTIIEHTIMTGLRLVIGTIVGTALGIAAGLAIWRYTALAGLVLPTVLAFRAVPAIAIVPFFLLWFGFSDFGKILLVATTLGFNLAVATFEALTSIDDKFKVAFRSFGREPRELPLSFGLPYVMPIILPTLRYSIVVAFGAVIVAELLGSQVGLGYLIQTSRSTFSMHAVMLAMFILGLLTVGLDWGVREVWTRLIPWRELDEKR